MSAKSVVLPSGFGLLEKFEMRPDGAIVIAKDKTMLQFVGLQNAINDSGNFEGKISFENGLFIIEFTGFRRPPHEGAVSYLNSLISNISAASQDQLLFNVGQCGVEGGNHSYNPDVSVVVCVGEVSARTQPNLIGEVLFSDSLARGHAKANHYLKHCDVYGVILVDIFHPWPMIGDGNNRRLDVDNQKLVFYFYEHPNLPEDVGVNIVPTAVVVFGDMQLSSGDLTEIVNTTGVDVENISGFVGDNPPCSANCPYTYTLPDNVLLVVNRDDQMNVAQIPLAQTPHNLKMHVNMFDLKRQIKIGACLMNRRIDAAQAALNAARHAVEASHAVVQEDVALLLSMQTPNPLEVCDQLQSDAHQLTQQASAFVAAQAALEQLFAAAEGQAIDALVEEEKVRNKTLS